MNAQIIDSTDYPVDPIICESSGIQEILGALEIYQNWGLILFST